MIPDPKDFLRGLALLGQALGLVRQELRTMAAFLREGGAAPICAPGCECGEGSCPAS